MSADLAIAAPAEIGSRTEAIQKRLGRRKAQERRFQLYGLAAVCAALAMVGVLFGSVLVKGVPAFWQATVNLDVTLNPAVIDIAPRPVKREDQSQAEYRQELTKWERGLARVNWNRILETAVRATLPPQLADAPARDVVGLITSGERYALRDIGSSMTPRLIGKTVRLHLLADADVDVWLKGNIDRTLPQNRQQLSAIEQQIADALYEEGVITMSFNTGIFLNVDSRSSPASAGLAGAFMGSLYMLLVVHRARRSHRRGELDLPGGVRHQEPAQRSHRGEHQQPRGGPLDRLRPARRGRVHQLVPPAAARRRSSAAWC